MQEATSLGDQASQPEAELFLLRKAGDGEVGAGELGQAGTARGWTRVVIHPAHPTEGEFEFLVHTGRPVSTCEPHGLMLGWARLSEQTAVSAQGAVSTPGASSSFWSCEPVGPHSGFS